MAEKASKIDDEKATEKVAEKPGNNPTLLTPDKRGYLRSLSILFFKILSVICGIFTILFGFILRFAGHVPESNSWSTGKIEEQWGASWGFVWACVFLGAFIMAFGLVICEIADDIARMRHIAELKYDEEKAKEKEQALNDDNKIIRN